MKIAQRERIDVYTIPPNFAQEGTIFSGRVRFWNAFEAGFLGFFFMKILYSMGWSVHTKIYAGVIVILPVVIFAVLGVQGESLTSFLFQFLRYLYRRRILTIPDGKYRLKRNRRLRKRIKKSQREKGGGYYRRRDKRIKGKTSGGKAGRKAEPERRKTAT